MAAGAVVDEAGIADDVAGFGIGAGERPDGAAAAEVSGCLVVVEQAAVDAHGGEAARQQVGAGDVGRYGAAVVAGEIVAEGAIDEPGLNGGAHGSGHENRRAPADCPEGAGIALEQAMADVGADGSVAAGVHADTAATRGVVVPEGAVQDAGAADGAAGAVDEQASAQREAEWPVGIGFFNDESVEDGSGVDVIHDKDPVGIVRAVHRVADVAAQDGGVGRDISFLPAAFIAGEAAVEGYVVLQGEECFPVGCRTGGAIRRAVGSPGHPDLSHVRIGQGILQPGIGLGPGSTAAGHTGGVGVHVNDLADGRPWQEKGNNKR